MKIKLYLLSIALTLPALAQSFEPVEQEASYSDNADYSAQPSYGLLHWFIGASMGGLVENEAVMGNFNFGIYLPSTFAGCRTSLFMQSGYFSSDEDSFAGVDFSAGTLSLNVKLEHSLSGNLGAYIGGGVGFATTHSDFYYRGYLVGEDDNVVLTGQLFAGLAYHFNSIFEVYGGASWFYVDSDYLDSKNDALLELGLRANF